MNNLDMLDKGIQEKQTVDIESAHGKMSSVQVHEFDLPRGNLMAYYPEANALAGPHFDPRSMTPNFKSIAVRLKI